MLLQVSAGASAAVKRRASDDAASGSYLEEAGSSAAVVGKKRRTMDSFVLPNAVLAKLKYQFARCILANPGCLPLRAGEFFSSILRGDTIKS